MKVRFLIPVMFSLSGSQFYSVTLCVIKKIMNCHKAPQRRHRDTQSINILRL